MVSARDLGFSMVPFMWVFTGFGMEKNLPHMGPWCRTYEVVKHDLFSSVLEIHTFMQKEKNNNNNIYTVFLK